MAISIKDPETERLAKLLARLTGESITLATKKALQERLERVKRRENRLTLFAELEANRLRMAALPILDPRTPDEIIGYDERGLPS